MTPLLPGAATGDEVGSIQGSQFAAHQHSLGGDGKGGSYIQNFGLGGGGAGPYYIPAAGPLATIPNTGNTSYTGGTETRPLNAYVNYIIKN